MNSGERVAVKLGNVSSATRTRRSPRLANQRCASRTLLGDPLRRSRAIRRTTASSTARSRAEADWSSLSLHYGKSQYISRKNCWSLVSLVSARTPVRCRVRAFREWVPQGYDRESYKALRSSILPSPPIFLLRLSIQRQVHKDVIGKNHTYLLAKALAW